jgi:acetylornithine deacetylase
LEGLGLAIAEFSPIDVPGYSTSDAFLHERSYQGRKNVVGVWKGTGGGRSLLLSWHIDVAPQTPLPWTVCEPYHSIVKGDEIFGRGAADMKGGLACALVAIKMLHDRGFVPRGDIIFESVVDEEFAGYGGTIASRLMGYNAEFGILLEPSGLMICPACVGGIIFKVRLKGSAGMPYTGEEVDNPVYYLPDIIRLTREWDQNRKSVATRPHLWEKTPQEPQIIITRVKAGEVVGDGQLSTPIDAWMEVIVQTYPGEKDDVVADDYSAYLRERLHDPSSLTVEREYHYCRPAMLQTTTPAVDNLAQSAKRFTDKAIV